MNNKRSFSGTVAFGAARAGSLGFPTVNITLSDDNVSGIYAGEVKHADRTYHAAVFADQKRKLLEAYLLDFEEDLYGEEISITLLKKIRENELFTDDAVL